MYDFHTAMQIALSPVVTLSVIAILAITIAAQAYFNARRMNDRLHAQAKRYGTMTGMLMTALSAELTNETDRRVSKAIEFTYDSLKGIGFAKLAEGNVTFEDVLFGTLPNAKPFQHRQEHRQEHDSDPFAVFSMDELMEALGGKPRYSGAKPGAETHSFEEPVKHTGKDGNDGGKGSRPYHKATDSDLGGRSPRAG